MHGKIDNIVFDPSLSSHHYHPNPISYGKATLVVDECDTDGNLLGDWFVFKAQDQSKDKGVTISCYVAEDTISDFFHDKYNASSTLLNNRDKIEEFFRKKIREGKFQRIKTSHAAASFDAIILWPEDFGEQDFR